jgi:hypothetical protein
MTCPTSATLYDRIGKTAKGGVANRLTRRPEPGFVFSPWTAPAVADDSRGYNMSNTSPSWEPSHNAIHNFIQTCDVVAIALHRFRQRELQLRDEGEPGHETALRSLEDQYCAITRAVFPTSDKSPSRTAFRLASKAIAELRRNGSSDEEAVGQAQVWLTNVGNLLLPTRYSRSLLYNPREKKWNEEGLLLIQYRAMRQQLIAALSRIGKDIPDCIHERDWLTADSWLLGEPEPITQDELFALVRGMELDAEQPNPQPPAEAAILAVATEQGEGEKSAAEQGATDTEPADCTPAPIGDPRVNPYPSIIGGAVWRNDPIHGPCRSNPIMAQYPLVGERVIGVGDCRRAGSALLNDDPDPNRPARYKMGFNADWPMPAELARQWAGQYYPLERSPASLRQWWDLIQGQVDYNLRLVHIEECERWQTERAGNIGSMKRAWPELADHIDGLQETTAAPVSAQPLADAAPSPIGAGQGEGGTPAADPAPTWDELNEAKRTILIALHEAAQKGAGRLRGEAVAEKAGYKYGSARRHFGDLQRCGLIDKKKDGYAITSEGMAIVPCELL